MDRSQSPPVEPYHLPPMYPPSYESATTNAPISFVTGPTTSVFYQPSCPRNANGFSNPYVNNNHSSPQQQQAPPIQQQVIAGKAQYKYQLVFALVNAFLFFPFVIVWVPALLFSLKSRTFFRIRNFPMASRYARKAKIFNISCLVFGNCLVSVTIDFNHNNVKFFVILLNIGIGFYAVAIVSLSIMLRRTSNQVVTGYAHFSDCKSNVYFKYVICESSHLGCTYGYHYDFYYKRYRFCYQCYKSDYSYYY